VTVAVQLDFEGATLDQYDRVMAEMPMPAGALPPGALFHWVAATESGIRVVDVWEDRETFQRFADEHIGPSMHAAGVDIAPQITFLDVHNHLPSTP
jgi:hypothetical protein